MSSRTILESELRTGDIIVTTGRAFVSGVIKSSTGTDYSHALLYIGSGQIIEAISTGVRECKLEQALSEASLAVALRRRNMTEISKQAVVNHAKRFRNRPYDSVGAIGAGLSHKRGKAVCAVSPMACLGFVAVVVDNASDGRKDNKFFCSELVARCFELAGLPIHATSPSLTTPRSVRVAANLMYLGHLVGGP